MPEEKEEMILLQVQSNHQFDAALPGMYRSVTATVLVSPEDAAMILKLPDTVKVSAYPPALDSSRLYEAAEELQRSMCPETTREELVEILEAHLGE